MHAPTELLCPVSGETRKEERVNFWTHFVGFFFSVAGLVFLVHYSKGLADPIHLVTSAIFGTSLILLYGASSYYHGCTTVSHKKILKIIDHSCIYLLIAGSYTPFALGPLRETVGWKLIYIEWGLACAGVIFKILAINRFQAFSLLAYLAMGWLAVFSFSELQSNLPGPSLMLLMLGGLAYTIGTIFYVWRSIPYNHAIWHIFVLTGSICHYSSILMMVGTAKAID